MDQAREQRLAGGGVNEVVRVGQTVRRPAGAWAPQVHELLRQLHSTGFHAAPVPQGFDEHGREVLSYLPGTVGHDPLAGSLRSPVTLISAAELLRDYHRATAELLAAAPLDGWQFAARAPVEVICHGDFAPYNLVFTGALASGVIDFDTAAPGPRWWDVSYAIYRFAPLSGPDGFGSFADQAARARLFCDAYGLEPAEREQLPERMMHRLGWLAELIRERAAAGDPGFASHAADGHDLLYLRHAHAVGVRADALRAVLCGQPG